MAGAAQADSEKLDDVDDAVLVSGDRRHRRVGTRANVPHTETNPGVKRAAPGPGAGRSALSVAKAVCRSAQGQLRIDAEGARAGDGLE